MIYCYVFKRNQNYYIIVEKNQKETPWEFKRRQFVTPNDCETNTQSETACNENQK